MNDRRPDSSGYRIRLIDLFHNLRGAFSDQVNEREATVNGKSERRVHWRIRTQPFERVSSPPGSSGTSNAVSGDHQNSRRSSTRARTSSRQHRSPRQRFTAPPAIHGSDAST